MSALAARALAGGAAARAAEKSAMAARAMAEGAVARTAEMVALAAEALAGGAVARTAEGMASMTVVVGGVTLAAWAQVGGAAARAAGRAVLTAGVQTDGAATRATEEVAIVAATGCPTSGSISMSKVLSRVEMEGGSAIVAAHDAMCENCRRCVTAIVAGEVGTVVSVSIWVTLTLVCVVSMMSKE